MENLMASKKVNNFCAKHSVNKSGAGKHKTVKDYKRKDKQNNKLQEI